MLPRSLRLPLRRKPGFFATARRTVYSSFIVFSQPSSTEQEENGLKIAFIAPKKQFPLATQRNAAKRRASQVCAEILQNTQKVAEGSQNAWLLVFLLGRRINEQSQTQLREEITRALRAAAKI